MVLQCFEVHLFSFSQHPWWRGIVLWWSCSFVCLSVSVHLNYPQTYLQNYMSSLPSACYLWLRFLQCCDTLCIFGFMDDAISHAHTVVWECCKDDQQSQWEMMKFDPQLPRYPLSDRHQIWHAWLRHGYLSPRKNWAQSVKGFLLPIYAKYTPPCSHTHVYYFFFGSSNRLQPRRLHGF